MSEQRVFQVDCIGEALQADLVGGLRAVADAIEATTLDGRLVKAEAYGFQSRHDTRAHVRVTLDLAAELQRTVDKPQWKELT